MAHTFGEDRLVELGIFLKSFDQLSKLYLHTFDQIVDWLKTPYKNQDEVVIAYNSTITKLQLIIRDSTRYYFGTAEIKIPPCFEDPIRLCIQFDDYPYITKLISKRPNVIDILNINKDHKIVPVNKKIESNSHVNKGTTYDTICNRQGLVNLVNSTRSFMNSNNEFDPRYLFSVRVPTSEYDINVFLDFAFGEVVFEHKQSLRLSDKLKSVFVPWDIFQPNFFNDKEKMVKFTNKMKLELPDIIYYIAEALCD